MMAISIHISGSLAVNGMFLGRPQGGNAGRRDKFQHKQIESTYTTALPELDHSIGRIDTEGPASPGGADGVAGRQALSHLQEVGILLVRFKCHAFDGRPAGKLLLGCRRRSGGGGEQQHKC